VTKATGYQPYIFYGPLKPESRMTQRDGQHAMSGRQNTLLNSFQSCHQTRI